jgi:hypothetical protein
MEKIKRTLISIGIFFASQIVISAIFIIAGMMQGMDINTALNSTLGLSLLVSDLLVVVLLLILKYCGIKELFQKVPVDVLLISIVFAICGMFAVEILSSSFEIPNKLEEQFQAMAGTVSGFLGICIVGPVMEEMIMRRVILKEMEQLTKSMWWGIIISSALFAIIHVNPIQVVFAMPAGIILGWLYCKTGSLLVPICVHIINNTVSFITMSIGLDYEITPNSTLGVILLISLLIITVLSAIWIVKYYSNLKKEQELQQAPVEVESQGDSSAGETVE